MTSSKQIVAGMGEIGTPIMKLLGKSDVVGYDINPKLMNEKKFKKLELHKTSFLHICIPFNNKFSKNVIELSKKFQPQLVVSLPF